jgi:hypothetical protein
VEWERGRGFRRVEGATLRTVDDDVERLFG